MKIRVDADLAEKLAKQRSDAVLYDDQGRALGFFSPMDKPTMLDELQLEPPISIEETEELRKRARENPGKPLEEILSRLGY